MSDSSSGNLRRFFRKILVTLSSAPTDPPLREIDRRIAKEYIKRRLLTLYPELHQGAEALERAYHELDLEARGTLRRGDGEVKTFALRVSQDVVRPFDRK